MESENKCLDFITRFFSYMAVSLGGGVCMGIFLASIAFPFAKSTAAFGAGFGFPMGGFVGMVFGLLSFWPLRKVSMPKIFSVLAGCSLFSGLCAISVCVFSGIGELAPVASWFSCMLGYWIGVIVVGLENPFKGRKQPQELLKENVLVEEDGDESHR